LARVRESCKERIREAVDFAELVGKKVELRRVSARNYIGRCPIHEERTGSFSIDIEKKVFNCFGCGASGDVFRYIELTEGVDFRTAMELLAERHGIELELEEEDPREKERRERHGRLTGLLERAAEFYVRCLWSMPEAEPARRYLLEERGFTEETLRTFRVGWSPSGWTTMVDGATRSGYSPQDLYAVGLAARRDDGRTYDRFRERIMFPLAEARGRIVGFGARVLGDAKPKYINTRESEIFHKGQILYGAHLAREVAAKRDQVIVCEGYTDVLALHQAGIVGVVACMGTSLTEEQVQALAKMAHTAHLAFDADAAGAEAMIRAQRIAADVGVNLKVMRMPEGKDPADVAQDGTISGIASMPFARFHVEHILASADLSTPEGCDAALDELRPVFKVLRPGATWDDLLRKVADATNISPRLAQLVLSGDQVWA
jgi:DNA primase